MSTCTMPLQIQECISNVHTKLYLRQIKLENVSYLEKIEQIWTIAALQLLSGPFRTSCFRLYFYLTDIDVLIDSSNLTGWHHSSKQI